MVEVISSTHKIMCNMCFSILTFSHKDLVWLYEDTVFATMAISCPVCCSDVCVCCS